MMLRSVMCGLGKKNNTVIRLPPNGMLVTITHNVNFYELLI